MSDLCMWNQTGIACCMGECHLLCLSICVHVYAYNEYKSCHLQENVAVVEFNASARIVQHLSADYIRCRRAVGKQALLCDITKSSNLNLSVNKVLPRSLPHSSPVQ